MLKVIRADVVLGEMLDDLRRPLEEKHDKALTLRTLPGLF